MECTREFTTVVDEGNRYNYEMSRGGIGLLFNHENFNLIFNESEQVDLVENREGTSYDAQELINTFQNFNIDLEICQDFNLEDVKEKINEVSELDHSRFDCLLVIVLTHGILNSDGQELIYSKDKVYSPSELWLPFSDERCPSLAGKPKLFIIQSCRGSECNKGLFTSLIKTPSESNTNMDQTYSDKRVHNMPDLLIARSTFIGYKSFRYPDSGSIYIDILTKIMKSMSTDLDIISLLTKVNYEVSRQTFRYTDPATGKISTGMQIPCFTSTLTKRLNFA